MFVLCLGVFQEDFFGTVVVVDCLTTMPEDFLTLIGLSL